MRKVNKDEGMRVHHTPVPPTILFLDSPLSILSCNSVKSDKASIVGNYREQTFFLHKYVINIELFAPPPCWIDKSSSAISLSRRLNPNSGITCSFFLRCVYVIGVCACFWWKWEWKDMMCYVFAFPIQIWDSTNSIGGPPPVAHRKGWNGRLPLWNSGKLAWRHYRGFNLFPIIRLSPD